MGVLTHFYYKYCKKCVSIVEKDYLTQLVAEGKSIRQISKIVNKSNGAVRHWLRKYNLTTYKPPKYVDNCKFCNVKLTTENTYDSKKRWACKLCLNKYRSKQFVSTKHKMVEYKGGKCICCGFDKHYSALDFHHLDPSIKEFNLNRNSIGWEKLKPELDKCVLLCSNCHRMIHAEVIQLPDDPASDGTCLTSRH